MAYLRDASCILALTSGVSLHIFIYRHGDWDTKSPAIALAYLLLLLSGTVVTHSFPSWDNSRRGSSSDLLSLFACHLTGVYGSMLIYRAFFHRLFQFPGPFLARLSNFYVTALAAKNLQLHEELQGLHAKYGDYVRLGRSQILFRTFIAAN
jgi:hypothetical protein